MLAVSKNLDIKLPRINNLELWRQFGQCRGLDHDYAGFLWAQGQMSQWAVDFFAKSLRFSVGMREGRLCERSWRPASRKYAKLGSFFAGSVHKEQSQTSPRVYDV
jgi:hypothetical protein